MNLCKRLIVTAVMAVILTAALPLFAAGPPTTLSYRGFLKNSSLEPINGPQTVTVNLYSVPSGGTSFWSETQAVNVHEGNFSIVLGNTNPLNPNQFSNNVYVGLTVGSNSEMTPRQTLVSMPFAFNAFNGVPQGVIVMWSGALNQVPSGWAPCDGTNGTPDLRDRFVVGGGGTYANGQTGGETAHVLTVDEMPSHTHIQNAHNHTQNPHRHNQAQAQINGTGSTAVADNDTTDEWTTASTTATNNPTTATNQNTGRGLPHNNLPPYYAIAFIMKL